jgi:hypothetical protein
MAAIGSVRCLYVDNVPTMFDVADIEPYRTWYRSLVKSGRAKFGLYLGEYPLPPGPLLDESMRLYREVIYPLIPIEERRPIR